MTIDIELRHCIAGSDVIRIWIKITHRSSSNSTMPQAARGKHTDTCLYLHLLVQHHLGDCDICCLKGHVWDNLWESLDWDMTDVCAIEHC